MKRYLHVNSALVSFQLAIVFTDTELEKREQHANSQANL